MCIFQARCPDHGPLAWPCPASSPGAYGRARALPEPCAPRRLPATADPASSVPGVATLLPPRPLGTAAPERGHWTCGARRIETTTPESQCESARARCGAVGGATSGPGKRRGVSGCERPKLAPRMRGTGPRSARERSRARSGVRVAVAAGFTSPRAAAWVWAFLTFRWPR